MTFERTFDYSLVSLFVKVPNLWPYLTDDFAPSIDDFEVARNPQYWYVLVGTEVGILGLFFLVPISPILYDFHTVMPLDVRALQAMRELLGPGGWLWANTECLRAETYVPEFNKIALRFGLRAGLTQFGRSPKSYLRDGVLQDRILLGIGKS